MFRSIILAVALLAPAVATAQQGYWAEFAPGVGVGIVVTADGKMIIFNSLTILKSGDDPTANPYTVPSASARTTVDPITRIAMSAEHGTAAAGNFSQAAQQVESGVVKTTSELAQGIVARGKLLAIPKTYTGLSAAVDKALETLVGTTDRPVTPADATALRAIAWALWEAGH